MTSLTIKDKLKTTPQADTDNSYRVTRQTELVVMYNIYTVEQCSDARNMPTMQQGITSERGKCRNLQRGTGMAGWPALFLSSTLPLSSSRAMSFTCGQWFPQVAGQANLAQAVVLLPDYLLDKECWTGLVSDIVGASN